MPQIVNPPRRIKSKHDLGDVLMDFTTEEAINVPDEIKQVLMDMTLGGSDQLHLWEVEKCAEILARVKGACAPADGKAACVLLSMLVFRGGFAMPWWGGVTVGTLL